MSTEARTRPRKGATKNPNTGGSVAVAALRMETLCAWAIERAEGFPRKVKFSLGDRFIDANLLVVERLVEAAYLRDKRAVLQAASRARAPRAAPPRAVERAARAST
jgi:hypothetical protein